MQPSGSIPLLTRADPAHVPIPGPKSTVTHCICVLFQQPTEYFDMGIFLAFFVVVSLVCLILLVKIKLKQRRSQVMAPERPITFIPEAPLPVQTRAGC